MRRSRKRGDPACRGCLTPYGVFRLGLCVACPADSTEQASARGNGCRFRSSRFSTVGLVAGVVRRPWALFPDP